MPWEHEAAEEVDAQTDEPDQAIIEDEERLRLRKAVDRLSPKHRAVVVLRLIDGLSTAETADILHVPYGTVLSRLKRGLSKLKEHLGDKSGAATERVDGATDGSVLQA